MLAGLRLLLPPAHWAQPHRHAARAVEPGAAAADLQLLPPAARQLLQLLLRWGTALLVLWLLACSLAPLYRLCAAAPPAALATLAGAHPAQGAL